MALSTRARCSERITGPITVAEARRLLGQGFTSAVGHEGTAALLSQLLDIEVPINRVTITMAAGDAAVVLRVKQRLPEGVVLSAEQMRDFPHELSLLTRIS